MTLLTRKSYNDRVRALNDPYWTKTAAHRWAYMSVVIEEIRKIKPRWICEAGVAKMPLCSKSFIIDLVPESLEGHDGMIYDLNKIPYPLADKQFDLFVALQVWEHLLHPRRAFLEVTRISYNAILSFPYKWDCDPKNPHFMITSEVISSWTLQIKPKKVQRVGTRIIYIWEF
jgi:hypothetical protein